MLVRLPLGTTFLLLSTIVSRTTALVVRSTPAKISTAKAIQWVDCSKNVPSPQAFDATGVNMANLPPTLHCGRLQVPMDYSKPEGQKITLGFAMRRPVPSKGVVFFNAGLDVRGTYASNQLNGSVAAYNAFPADLPTSESSYKAYQAASAALARSWIDQSSPPGILNHVRTQDVVQDYESLRIALGYAKRHFLGYSYGTVAGAEYAHRFPDSTGRFVLDGVVAHGLHVLEQASDLLFAANRALTRADAYCVWNTSCPFHTQGKGAVQAAFKKVVASAPLVASACLNTTTCYSNVTAHAIQQSVYGMLQGSPDYPALFQALELALAGDGSLLATGPAALVTSLLVIPLLCADTHLENNTYAGFADSIATTVKIDTNLMRYSLGWKFQLACSGWLFSAAQSQPRQMKQPILWVTADYDLNTPTEWATRAWQQAPHSVLVVRHGDNHGSFILSGQPARRIEIDYLTTGVLPSARNETLVSVYTRGMTRAPVADPYLAPIGVAAGDVDSSA